MSGEGVLSDEGVASGDRAHIIGNHYIMFYYCMSYKLATERQPLFCTSAKIGILCVKIW